MKIGYTFVIADMLHYGILQLLEAAKESCDRLICGVLTDEAARKARSETLSNYNERKAVVEAVRHVDEVMAQDAQDPTENLKAIRGRYPDAEIVFVYGDNWAEIPGQEYLKSINAKTLRQDFYDNLSPDRIRHHTIKSALPDTSVLETFTSGFSVKDFEVFRKDAPPFVVSTKAKTLQTLKPLLTKFHIEKTYVFTTGEWKSHGDEIVSEIAKRFSEGRVVVRSSCLSEDAMDKSNAGYYDSMLDVDPQDDGATRRAIDAVAQSYRNGENYSGLDQVLVQRQTTDIAVSGVLFTVDLETNAPYYVINYDDSGRTDTVTAGLGGRLMKIFRGTDPDRLDKPWRVLLEAVREVESIVTGFPLDIEFAVTKEGRAVLFQARPLAANINNGKIDTEKVEQCIGLAGSIYGMTRDESACVFGGDLIFSDMIFWNPAELIGHRPSNLAYSLFDRLVMDKAWNLGVTLLGYPNLYPSKLMSRVLYKPYINANLAFLSMVPASVPAKFRDRLMSYFLTKLRDNPHLHDKAEFEIMFTCWDFAIGDRLAELADYGFSKSEVVELEKALLGFSKDILNTYGIYDRRMGETISALDRESGYSLVDHIETMRREKNLYMVKQILDSCENKGTIPFSAAARLAFMSGTLIRSMVGADVISSDERDLIMNSFSTVATDLTRDMNRVAGGEMGRNDFMERYGHLRAGTYDIEKKRYDQYEDASWLDSLRQVPEATHIPDELKARISKFAMASPLGCDFDMLYDFARCFTVSREHYKYVYTKALSNALEIIREAGALCNISAHDIAYLGIDEVFTLFSQKPESLRRKIETARQESVEQGYVMLPPLIFSSDDFNVLNYPVSRPNFITGQRVHGEICVVGNGADEALNLRDKIVFIENADPGYHWVFSRNIRGLVTKYGGAASHMAICCAEFNIPAAIGCGVKYDQLKLSNELWLDCSNQIITEKHDPGC